MMHDVLRSEHFPYVFLVFFSVSKALFLVSIALSFSSSFNAVFSPAAFKNQLSMKNFCKIKYIFEKILTHHSRKLQWWVSIFCNIYSILQKFCILSWFLTSLVTLLLVLVWLSTKLFQNCGSSIPHTSCCNTKTIKCV